MKAQKTFYPIISIKTLENRLIHARNREFHPKTKSVGAQADSQAYVTDTEEDRRSSAAAYKRQGKRCDGLGGFGACGDDGACRWSHKGGEARVYEVACVGVLRRYRVGVLCRFTKQFKQKLAPRGLECPRLVGIPGEIVGAFRLNRAIWL